MAGLFDGIEIGAAERRLRIRNRLWISPMCQYSVFERDGVPTDWHLMHLGQFAAGGAGLVISEATAVLPEGRITPRDTGIWTDEQALGWERVVRFIHGQGAAAGIQLAHAGRKASIYDLSGQDAPDGLASGPGSETLDQVRWWTGGRGSVPLAAGGWRTVGPTALPYGRYAPPEALGIDGIERIVDAFGTAARRAEAAGFDVIEIHAAHGYLLHEFLSPLVNTRTDAYGGSLDDRARLLREVVERVRSNAPRAALFVRFSGTDWVDGGWTVEDTALIARQVEALGADLIDVSSGGTVPDARIPVGPGYQVPLAVRVRGEVTIPVTAVGLITDSAQADELVRGDHVDAVMIGRQALADPHLAFRMAVELGLRLPYVPGPYGMAYSEMKNLFEVTA